MLYQLVRPVKRSGSSIPYFVQRIPADVKAKAVGLRLAVPLGDQIIPITITSRTSQIRFSLRTRDPSEAKARQGVAAAYLERVWQALRQDAPVALTHKQAVALAGRLYRRWADGEGRERTLAVEHVHGEGWRRADNAEDAIEAALEDHEADHWEAALRHIEAVGGSASEASDLEKPLGAVLDRLLLAEGIAALDGPSRALALKELAKGLEDAFAKRQRNAEGDYSPDPKAERFPEWEAPREPGGPAPRTSSASATGKRQTLTGLVEDWWTKEARGRGVALSTYERYRYTVRRFVALIGHDDAARATPDDVIRFKEHRLQSTHPRTGKPISPKTVKDSDLAGLKAVFAWAVENRRMADNPAKGVTLRLGKKPRLRERSFTDGEAEAVLAHAWSHRRGGEREKTWAAKRWIPWLCAYTGARLGEMAQLRKQDVRREGEHWVVRITPDAGTVKTKEARDVPLHPHLVELGFPAFVAAAPAGHLFLTPNPTAQDPVGVRGPWRGVKNRLAEFAREAVSDPNVGPHHAWRHRFKVVGLEAGVEGRVLDAICGQAPRTLGEDYGNEGITLRTKADAIARFPRYEVGGGQDEEGGDGGAR